MSRCSAIILKSLVPSLALLSGALTGEEFSPVSAPATQPTVKAEGQVTVTGDKEGDFKVDSSTATKFDLPLHETPQSITVVPKALLESTGAFSLRDALRGVPGVTMAAGEGGRTGDSLNIRGFTAHSDQYLDGLKDNGQYFRDTFHLGAVEVLKGPASILYGRGATGGAVNSVTKRPDEVWQADGSVTAGGWNFLRFQGGAGGPLVDDSVYLRGDAFFQDSDSFRDNQHSNRVGVAPVAVFNIAESTNLTLHALHQREDSTMDYGVPMYAGRPADVDASTYYGWKEDSFQQYDVTLATAIIDHELTPSTSLANRTRVADYQRYYRVETLGSVDYTNDTVSRSQALRQNDQNNLINQTELSFTGTVNDRELKIVGGFEFAFEDYTFKNKNSDGETPVDVFNPNSPDTVGTGTGNGIATNLSGTLATDRSTETMTFSLYALAIYEFADRWHAMIGGRVDQFNAEVSNYAGTPSSFDNDSTMFSPRAGFVWETTDEIATYASFSTAFNPSAETFNLNESSENLDPEETYSFEIGAKGDFLDGDLALSAAVFRIEKINARTDDPTNTSVDILDGKQYTNGIEFGAAGQITNRWAVYGGLVFLDAKIASSNDTSTTWDGEVVSEEGLTPTNTPEASGNVWATYAWDHGLTFGGGVYYTSSRWADGANSVKIPGYFRTDASVTWQHRRDDADWFIRLNIFNLLDRTYWESGSSRSAYPGAPLNAQLTIGAAF